MYDATYLPAALNVEGRNGTNSVLPQPDGRFVVVTGQQSSMPTVQISVRFYLPDGKPDTVRGDANGERLVYPSGMGTYADAPISGVNDAGGKILILARWDRGPNNSELVMILFSVPPPSGSQDDPYFVVYVFRSNGPQDVSVPSGGRISRGDSAAGRCEPVPVAVAFGSARTDRRRHGAARYSGWLGTRDGECNEQAGEDLSRKLPLRRRAVRSGYRLPRIDDLPFGWSISHFASFCFSLILALQ